MTKPDIYFSGSIRGGRADQALYRELIGHIRGYGTVLTEHLGDEGLTPEGEEGMSDTQIFRRDVEWIRKADVFIAEVTVPSLGVGYEIATAEAHGIPALCLFRIQKGRYLSAMISGNETLVIKRYRDVEEAFGLLDDFFASIGLARIPARL